MTNPINIELILKLGVPGVYLHFNIIFKLIKSKAALAQSARSNVLKAA